ncbi:hypothetical protein O1611_g1246 [Lasiodiplodia mahajangana]|uniref:Uncharacterized protein n=1 Tax=Lasiodiplodia mahajangana TaxID=1108764 RepID=A0ACC2JXZ4_9PEZI|nr:hypothetical protein O1611_g1246 [Lasiodiplodia mahajangana]
MAVDESDSLIPLPQVVRGGSIAISIFGLASFFSALALFLYLTYKVSKWRLRRKPGRGNGSGAPGHVFANGPVEFGPAHDAAKLAASDPTVDSASFTQSECSEKTQYPNQFIVLIVNLLIADLHQATAFALSTAWVAQDAIYAQSGTCFAQGLFISTGDLASSCFMSAVAIHTFYSIVYNYRPPHKSLYIYICCLWIFIYLISLLPVAGTSNGASAGGFFVRAGAWCWINREYGDIRLLTHYIFIFIGIILSWALYTAIFISLRRQQKRGDLAGTKNSGYHPAFLVYPVIYLICILPLAIGRVATMAGKEPSLGYFCFAGALAASNGWLDVLLFTTTRRSIVFAQGDDIGKEDTGVKTFTFMNWTPNTFGNTVWVRGGRNEQPRKPPTGGWWRILGDPELQERRQSRLAKSLSQTSLTPLERNAIQMEVVTSIVVEDDRNRSPHRTLESSSTPAPVLNIEPYRLH